MRILCISAKTLHLAQLKHLFDLFKLHSNFPVVNKNLFKVRTPISNGSLTFIPPGYFPGSA